MVYYCCFSLGGNLDFITSTTVWNLQNHELSCSLYDVKMPNPNQWTWIPAVQWYLPTSSMASVLWSKATLFGVTRVQSAAKAKDRLLGKYDKTIAKINDQSDSLKPPFLCFSVEIKADQSNEYLFCFSLKFWHISSAHRLICYSYANLCTALKASVYGEISVFSILN